jgi:ATP-dependent DNA ligase
MHHTTRMARTAKPQPRKSSKNEPVEPGAISAEELVAQFPPVHLPIQPPYPPMEAKSAEEIPGGSDWIYEPKWDGFRCIAFRDGDIIVMQSKAGQPLDRYFPEMVEALGGLPQRKFVLDGEIVIEQNGHLSFDDLLMRIHPAASRIKKLSQATPTTYLVFDMLVDEQGKSLVGQSLKQRRAQLEEFAAKLPRGGSIRLSPSTHSREQAVRWITELASAGFDGVVAKLSDMQYASGERTGMRKIKRIRTADCVVGGFRYASKGDQVGSLLLGLYDDDGMLHHCGFTSSFNAEKKQELRKILKPYMGGEGFTGRAPGGPSRWSTERSGEWEKLDPKLVVEVQYDHFSGDRFRHGTKFMRWRPDKKSEQCTFEQVRPVRKGRGALDRLMEVA